MKLFPAGALSLFSEEPGGVFFLWPMGAIARLKTEIN